jgi:RimJ/RimL family protein N-acetyltransferase
MRLFGKKRRRIQLEDEPEPPGPIPVLQTDRLILRPWALEDAGALLSILQEEEMLRYMPPSPTPPDLGRVQRYIQRHLVQWHTRGYGHWAVVYREGKEKEVLGWTGLEYLSDLQEIEVAYLLRRSAWGKGLATEAVQAAVQFGFEQIRLDKIIGLVHPENIASARVLQKCGMTYVKHLALWGMELDWYSAKSA